MPSHPWPAYTGCHRCRDHQARGKKVTGSIPLTSILGSRLGGVAKLEPGLVVPYLQKNLQWRAQRVSAGCALAVPPPLGGHVRADIYAPGPRSTTARLWTTPRCRASRSPSDASLCRFPIRRASLRPGETCTSTPTRPPGVRELRRWGRFVSPAVSSRSAARACCLYLVRILIWPSFFLDEACAARCSRRDLASLSRHGVFVVRHGLAPALFSYSHPRRGAVSKNSLTS